MSKSLGRRVFEATVKRKISKNRKINDSMTSNQYQKLVELPLEFNELVELLRSKEALISPGARVIPLPPQGRMSLAHVYGYGRK